MEPMGETMTLRYAKMLLWRLWLRREDVMETRSETMTLKETKRRYDENIDL